MAIKLKDLEATGTRWGDITADYPQGTFIDGTGEGNRDGSYCIALWANELFGAIGAVLKEGKQTPNGQPEKASNSQYLTALKEIMKERIYSLSGDPTAVAGGTANALTATFTKPVALSGGQRILVQAIARNTSGNVTINANGLSSKPIKKGANKVLNVGDIAGNGYWISLVFDVVNQAWILLNPATGVELILPEATTAQKGVIQIATDSEVVNGTVKNKAVTPKQVKDNLALKASIDSPTFTGSVIVPTPTSSSNPATKKYVDNRVPDTSAFAKKDLSNVTKPYVTEAWKSADGTSWYQKFSDGLIMQAMTGGTMFTLPVPFKDSSYLVISSASYEGNTGLIGRAQTPTKTNTSVKFSTEAQTDWAKVSFIAIGH